jgi:hypothetical protein
MGGAAGGVVDPSVQSPGPHIIVDQFGYRPNAEKIAVIRDPEVGFDSDRSFAPGKTYALVKASDDQAVLTGQPVPWRGGEVDASSGDRAWWFDFSSVTGPGSYYVLDVEKDVRSYPFVIAEDVYQEVLRHAVRTFFYQRAGFAKQHPYADEGWTDEASHLGPLQDKNCRLYSARSDESTERDLHGGWYDAGDYNKYTNWSAHYVISLLRTYRENPAAFGDDFGIPESGNGIPDIVDEAKWGADWHVRMQNDDGSALSIVGLASASPPSAATGQSLYGSPSTSATLSTAQAFAFASTQFRAFPELVSYADELLVRAEKAWDWADANPAVIFHNNSKEDGTKGLGAGQQEVSDTGRARLKLGAAVYLFQATGKELYRDYVDAHYASMGFINGGPADPEKPNNQDMLLEYAAAPGATPSVVDAIRTAFRTAMDNADAFPAIATEADPYLAHLPAYKWGSNATTSNQGNMYYNLVTHGIDPNAHADAVRAAERYVHYIHGVNPLGLVYLSNMYGAGAERSINEFYHYWFADKSELWDRVGVSTHGPPPGFLAGGANATYDWDSCCPDKCFSEENNAKCFAEPIEPPRNQPPQKSYKDFNTNWPLNSWEISENSCYYQVAYIRLLSKFVGR